MKWFKKCAKCGRWRKQDMFKKSDWCLSCQVKQSRFVFEQIGMLFVNEQEGKGYDHELYTDALSAAKELASASFKHRILVWHVQEFDVDVPFD